MPDRGSVAMYEAVREVAGGGLDGCSGGGFGQRLGWWRSAVPRPGRCWSSGGRHVAVSAGSPFTECPFREGNQYSGSTPGPKKRIVTPQIPFTKDTKRFGSDSRQPPNMDRSLQSARGRGRAFPTRRGQDCRINHNATEVTGVAADGDPGSAAILSLATLQTRYVHPLSRPAQKRGTP